MDNSCQNVFQLYVHNFTAFMGTIFFNFFHFIKYVSQYICRINMNIHKCVFAVLSFK